MVLAMIVPVVWFGAMAALVASVAGGILRAVQTKDYQPLSLFTGLVGFNAPNYIPNGLGSIFWLITYAALGAILYVIGSGGELASFAIGFNSSLGESFLLIPVALQAAALIAWPRLSYQSQVTVNQTSLSMLNPVGALSLWLNRMSNILKVVKPANWTSDKLPFILGFVSSLVSVGTFVAMVVLLVLNKNLWLLPAAALQLIVARLTLQLLLDENLNNLS